MIGEMLTERRVSDRAFLGVYVLSVLAGLAAATVFFLTNLGALAVLGILPFLGALAYARLSRISTQYRLFKDRLEIESGLLTRKIENVQLFRVRDVGLRQGLVGRLGNFGDVYIHSTDSSTPELHVRAIDAPLEFYQELRDLVAANRAQGRTMIVEQERYQPEA